LRVTPASEKAGRQLKEIHRTVRNTVKEIINSARAGFELNICAGSNVFHHRNRIQDDCLLCKYHPSHGLKAAQCVPVIIKHIFL